jgi:hypothetical protein
MTDAILCYTYEYCANTIAFGKPPIFPQLGKAVNRRITEKRCGERSR